MGMLTFTTRTHVLVSVSCCEEVGVSNFRIPGTSFDLIFSLPLWGEIMRKVMCDSHDQVEKDS